MSSKDKKIHKSGLTSQEYSFKFAIPLETLVSNQSSKMSNEKNSFICKNLNAEQKTILKTYFDLKLLDTSENEIKIRYMRLKGISATHIILAHGMWEATPNDVRA